MMDIWAVSSKKVPNGLSRCHTKRRMGVCGRPHPSFGMTLTFFLIFNFYLFLLEKSVSYQKKDGRAWYDND